MKKLLISAAVVAITAGAASAQTIFDGGYYGFGVGFGGADATNFDGSGNLALRGGLGSAFVGWNFSRGNMVYGFEADVSLGKVEGAATCVNPAWTCDAGISTLASYRGRIGVVQKNTLFYATGGAAAARMTAKTINAALVEFPDTKTVSGWVLGVGVEGKMGNSPWRYRGEIMYHDFGTDTFNTDVPYNIGTTLTTARFGLVTSF